MNYFLSFSFLMTFGLFSTTHTIGQEVQPSTSKIVAQHSIMAISMTLPFVEKSILGTSMNMNKKIAIRFLLYFMKNKIIHIFGKRPDASYLTQIINTSLEVIQSLFQEQLARMLHAQYPVLNFLTAHIVTPLTTSLIAYSIAKIAESIKNSCKKPDIPLQPQSV